MAAILEFWAQEQFLRADNRRAGAEQRLPTLYLPHGGGPCFFMEWTLGPADTWERTAAWLQGLGRRFKDVSTLLVVSAHWEEPVVTVQTSTRPSLYYDYYGFPAHTYALAWPAPGAPAIARCALELLAAAGIECREDPERGFDHGTFIPLKVAFPDAQIPTVQISLHASLDPKKHLAIGRALAPLRSEGVLVVGSGMSFHNMGAFMGSRSSLEQSRSFDAWLSETCAALGAKRATRLIGWSDAPSGRYCHPREEHLLPLMVVAGAAEGERGHRVFEDVVLGVKVSAFEFGVDSSADAGSGNTSASRSADSRPLMIPPSPGRG